MRNKLSNFANCNVYLRVGISDGKSGITSLNQAIEAKFNPASDGSVLLFCSNDHSKVTFLYNSDSRMELYMGDAEYPPGILPWPETVEEFTSWSEEKRDNFFNTLFEEIAG